MQVEDYYQSGKRWWFRLHEKGGKRHEVPAHHNAEEYMGAYLQATGIGGEKNTPLFRGVNKSCKLTDRPMNPIDVFRMIKKRAKECGLPSATCCHTFRATGITAYVESGLVNKSTVSQLTENLNEEYEAFHKRNLSRLELERLFVDGVAEKLR